MWVPPSQPKVLDRMKVKKEKACQQIIFLVLPGGNVPSSFALPQPCTRMYCLTKTHQTVAPTVMSCELKQAIPSFKLPRCICHSVKLLTNTPSLPSGILSLWEGTKFFKDAY